MGFLNIGKKDEYGHQRRIEHRGKYLRASRTGGVALRAQAKAMGASLTANTKHGFRVSTTPLKNTQVALQNGRFVLRGRYSHGPLQFNLSKTGVSASTRNRLGSFNWVKPNRSSAKIFGVQFRGRKAASMQMFYMLFMAAGAIFKVVTNFFIRFLEILIIMSGIIYRAAAASQYAFKMLIRKYHNWRLSKDVARLENLMGRDMDSWQEKELIAGAALIISAWGRGNNPTEVIPVLDQAIIKHDRYGPLERSREALHDTALCLEKIRAKKAAGHNDSLAILAMIANRLANNTAEQELPEIILKTDEIILKDGPRTVLQDRMLEVFGDFADLVLLEEDDRAIQLDEQVQRDKKTSNSDNGKLDLNRASLKELQALPHIGEERAKAIIVRRPFADINELKEIDGIGPKRLAGISKHATVG